MAPLKKRSASPSKTPPWSRSFWDPQVAALSIPIDSGPLARKYESALKTLRSKLGRQAPKSLCVIDLSGSSGAIVAGWELNTPLQIASMAKLALLVAAFQLRDDVRAVVQSGRYQKWKEVVPALKGAWGKSKSSDFKSLSMMPEFDRIFDTERFDAGADPLPEFRTLWPSIAKHSRYKVKHLEWLGAAHRLPRPPKPPETLKKSDPKKYDRDSKKYESDFKKFYDETLYPIPFWELLQLTIKWSDNEAASACTSLLGLPFIWAVLHQLGLYNERQQSGLWLGNRYRPLFGSEKFRAPGTSKTKPIGKRSSEPSEDGDDSDDATSTQVGTAWTTALVFAALAQGVLFQHNNNLAISPLEFSPGDVASQSVPENFYMFAERASARAFGTTGMHLSKIGILGAVKSECAHLLYLAQPDAPADAGTPTPATSPLTGRSVVVAALQSDSETLTSLGNSVLDIVQKLQPG